MSRTISAVNSGQFSIGGDLRVNRLGFGAMRIVGKNVWGQAENPEAVRETLAHLPQLGVDLIDTADSYGPYISEALIREVLHPYTGLTVATKGGLVRPDSAGREWAAVGRPEYLRHCVQTSLRRLGVERIDLWQLHRIDAKVPRDEQFGAIAEMQKEGLIRHAGLSEVGLDEIQAAGKYFKVATVQNQYNLVDRRHEAIVDYCEANNIGFIPWYPLAAGELAGSGSVLAQIAGRLEASASQVALAWLLKRSKVMLPIPGTGSVGHLTENVAAANLVLSDDDFAALTRLASA